MNFREQLQTLAALFARPAAHANEIALNFRFVVAREPKEARDEANIHRDD
jgi:hypothetical protein